MCHDPIMGNEGRHAASFEVGSTYLPKGDKAVRSYVFSLQVVYFSRLLRLSR